MRARIDPGIDRTTGPSGSSPSYEEFDVLEPVRAGIRARSLVETCDAMAIAALFLDGTGRILHVGRWAPPFLGSTVRIVADHLVGQSERSNREIQMLLNAVLAAAATDHASPTVVIENDQGRDALSITAYRCDDPSPHQLLKTILVLSRNEEPAEGFWLVQGRCSA